jgi:hypothetical protein
MKNVKHIELAMTESADLHNEITDYANDRVKEIEAVVPVSKLQGIINSKRCVRYSDEIVDILQKLIDEAKS